MSNTKSKKRDVAVPGMFCDIDNPEHTSSSTHEDDGTLAPDMQTVLDKQLEVIKKGTAFLNDYSLLLQQTETARSALTTAINDTKAVSVSISKKDMEEVEKKIRGLVKSVNDATTGCKTAVTTISEETKTAIRDTYKTIGDSMKTDIKEYTDKCIQNAQNVMDKKYNVLENKMNGHFMSNRSYTFHIIILVLSLVFGVFGVYILYPSVITAAMGWTIVALFGVFLFLLLMIRLSHM